MIARKRARLVWFAAEAFAATSLRSASSAPATSPLRPSAWALSASAPSCCGLISSAASTSSSSPSMSPFTDFMPPRRSSASTFFGSFSSSTVTLLERAVVVARDEQDLGELEPPLGVVWARAARPPCTARAPRRTPAGSRGSRPSGSAPRRRSGRASGGSSERSWPRSTPSCRSTRWRPCAAPAMRASRDGAAGRGRASNERADQGGGSHPGNPPIERN